MSYECEVKEQPVQPVLSIRTRSSVEDLPKVLGESYCAIADYLRELGERAVGPPFAAYYNLDLQNLDVEIGFPVFRALPGKGDIEAGELPGGKVATYLYTGPYSEMEPVYAALSQWMEDNGHEPTGVVYEMYLDDAAQTPPQEWRTQIVFPLK
jgi:effector-binding domain-containing protein